MLCWHPLALFLSRILTVWLCSCNHSFHPWAESSFPHLCLFRKQLQDLNGQHQQELAAQLAQFKVEMAEQEERQQQVAQDYELRC